jgi:NAD(P)-dependent dehydrogenase (short-subunit alcohol dehydrogenase family)
MANTVLITGGSGGIGKQTAISLVKEGFHVIITGRSLSSCTDAIAEIKEKSNNYKVDFIISDFNSLKSVQSLANEYKSKHNSLDILINNVGLLKDSKEFTEDGIEKTFAVNVLVPYLLSNLLFDLLAKSNSGKIITLSGGMHPKKIAFDNLQAEKSYVGIVNYSQSKLVMMTLMIAFGKTFAHSKVKSNICYPGQASTAMTRALTPQMFPWLFRLFFPILKFANRINKNNPDKSAQTASKSSIYLSLNPAAQSLHNSYINYKCKKVELPNAVSNNDNQRKILIYANQIIKTKLGLDLNNL